MKLVAGVAIALLSIAANADADCRAPHWVGTPTGTAIPQTGSLYVFDASLVHKDITPRGGPIVRQTKVGDTVVRLDYVTRADELELADAHYPMLYNVHATWKPPAAAPRVIQYWHQVPAQVSDEDAECASWNAEALNVQIDQPTAAFRVVWEPKGQPARQFVFPARTSDNNVSVLQLGSALISKQELALGGRLALFAIRFDGSEVAVAGLPGTISSEKMPTSTDGLTRAIGYQAGSAPTAPLPPTDHDWPFHLFLLLLIPAGALLYVAVRDRSVKAVA